MLATGSEPIALPLPGADLPGVLTFRTMADVRAIQNWVTARQSALNRSDRRDQSWPELAGWYALVAIAFSAERPRQHYLRSKLWLDRTAGAVMGLLGLKLISDLR